MEKILDHIIAKHLKNSELTGVFNSLEKELSLRNTRISKCKIYEVPTEVGKEADIFEWVPEGSVVAVLGKAKDPLFEELRDAVEEYNPKNMKKVLERLNNIATEFDNYLDSLLENDIPVSDQPAPEITCPEELPTLAEIRYRDKSLVNYFTVTDHLPINFQIFPYTGGTLKRNAFSVIEYYNEESDVNLDCLLILREPKLNEVEKTALKLIPSEQSENNIASGIVGVFPAVIVAAIITSAARHVAKKAAEAALAAAVAWVVTKVLDKVAGGIATSKLEGLLERQVTKDLMKELPPEASARELLEMRRKILLK